MDDRPGIRTMGKLDDAEQAIAETRYADEIDDYGAPRHLS